MQSRVEHPPAMGMNVLFVCADDSQYRDTDRPVWGCSVRTDSFRYTEWFSQEQREDVVDRELYAIEEDPFEHNNLAEDSAYQSTVKEHAQRIRSME